MVFSRSPLDEVYSISLEPHVDQRGFFARVFCEREFASYKLATKYVQWSISFNERKGTLRGMHFQLPPQQETKIVRCTKGSAYDVVLDLRRDSPTYLQWASFELTAGNHISVYVPPGCAHGFQTLEPKTELFYQISEFYDAVAASGVRWNDPLFGIKWPLPDPILSEQDQFYPDFHL
jgi:dTDP-4-dehydrorhamnose 3,5-epimerase